MSRSGELWMAEVEAAEERFCRNNDEEEFRQTMTDLGFYRIEIEDRIKELTS